MIIVDAISGRQRLKVTYEVPGHNAALLPDQHLVQVWKAVGRTSGNPTGIGEHVMDLVFTTSELADLSGVFPNKPRPSTSRRT